MTSIIVWCTLPSTPVEHQRDLELDRDTYNTDKARD